MRNLNVLYLIILLVFIAFCSLQLLLDGRVVITRSDENMVITIERFLTFKEKAMLGFSIVTASFITVTTLWFAENPLQPRFSLTHYWNLVSFVELSFWLGSVFVSLSSICEW